MPKKKGKQVNAAQQEKLEQKKLKKELARIGEDDIETILTQFKKADAAKVAVSEAECARPSPRINATLCAHPTKDALILFGGELFNGEKCWVYNDLFFFGTAKHEWRKISSPNTPPPRCAHQAVTLSRQGGQMWIFGGEFTSQTQTQFYHHKDLWVLNLATNAWEQVDAKNGPTPRSGHRMVAWKNKLVIFGGYFDNGRSVPKYMNELWLFDVESYKWQRVDFKEFEPQPNPRSGCQLMVHGDQVLLYGGYARTEAGGAGTVFDDLWSLNMTSLKWLKLKKAGVAPNPRTGQPWVPVERKKGAIMFGGVFDREETDEDIISTFCNDMFLFEYETKKFATFKLRRKRKSKVEKTLDKAAAEAAAAAKAEEESDESDYDEGCPTGVAKVEEFEAVDPLAKKKEEDAFFNTPGERSHCLLAVKGTMLYLYGGVREEGEREITLNDMHCLDTKSFDKWQLVQASDTVEWVGEEDDDDEEDGEEGDEDDSDSDEDDDDDEDDAPPKKGAAKAPAKGKAEKSGKAEKVEAKAAARKKGQDAPAAKSKKPAPAAAAPAPKLTAEQKAARKEEEKAARLASRLEKQAKIDEDAKEVNPFAAGTLRAEPHAKGADAGSESDE